MNISDLLATGQSTFAPQPPNGYQAARPPGAAPAPQRKSTKNPRKTKAKSQRKANNASGLKRKHKTYLSATQIAKRDAHAVFASQELNLTLDINDLQQLIRLLEERRDLHVTRLMVARQQFEHDVYHPSMLGNDMNAKSSLPFFVWQWGCYNNRFHHWQFSESSTRIVTFIEDDAVEDDSIVVHGNNSSRPVCSSGGCVVETIGEFTGSPTRVMVGAMFPNLLSDEGYTASLTQQTMRFPTRMMVYFDSRGKIVKHVLEADAFAALQAIVEANASYRTHIEPNERFTELSAPALAATEDLTGTSELSEYVSRAESELPVSNTGSRHDVGYLLN
ncbi:hypothetical protein KRP22_006421 [Phytophthora ramorum]|nr:hypothetical protein KRP22_2448 [Phytophthora ramorum]